jgi:hypothetical protein
MTDTQKQHIKQLQKAVELSRSNPDEPNPIQRERLRLDLYEFQLSSGVGAHYSQTKGDVSAALPERYVADMVQGLRDTFAKLAGEKQFPLVIETKLKDVHFRVYLQNPSMRFYLHANMEPGRDAAVYALLRHFEGSGLGLDRIQVCPREKCRNVFVLGSHARADRMRYCSVRCSRLAATQAFRQRKMDEKERKSKGKRELRRKKQAARSTNKKRGRK